MSRNCSGMEPEGSGSDYRFGEPSIGKAMGSGGTREGVMEQVVVSIKSNLYRAQNLANSFNPYNNSDFGGIIMCFTLPIDGGENLAEGRIRNRCFSLRLTGASG